jgi:hypothetical protein
MQSHKRPRQNLSGLSCAIILGPHRPVHTLVTMRPLALLASAAFALASAARLIAWDYEGHRAVNLTALSSLPTDYPAFVKAPAARERIAFLSGEPDRWRNVQDLPLKHAGSGDHFIDFEDFEPLGLTPATVSDLRYIFTSQIFAARAAHPERFPAIDPEKNKDRTRELIGYLPWAITESYARLKSGFSYLKAYEENGGTSDEIANAQANIVYLMGVMGHYVGDGSQPLHTTKHYNGWVGENPQGFTVDRKFHSWIDGGFLGKSGGLNLAQLEQQVKPALRLATVTPPTGRDPIFEHAVNYLLAQFALVEPLYALEKAGKLKPESPESKEGKAFLETQIVTAGHMLGSLWLTAWQEAPPDTYLRGQLLARQAKAAK